MGEEEEEGDRGGGGGRRRSRGKGGVEIRWPVVKVVCH